MPTLEDKGGYPPLSFPFAVSVTGADGAGEGSFSEVCGLDVEREVVDIKEGGENRFSHRLPDRAHYANLVLERGILLNGGPVALVP